MENFQKIGTQICIVAALLPFTSVVVGGAFSGTAPLQKFCDSLSDSIPLFDTWIRIVYALVDKESFVQWTYMIIARDFSAAIIMGALLYLLDMFFEISGISKLPILKYYTIFISVILCGMILNLIEKLGGIAAVMTQFGTAIIMIIGIAFLFKSVFSSKMKLKADYFIKSILIIIIDCILCVIVSAYMTTLYIYLENGFTAFNNGIAPFLTITCFTCAALLLDGLVNHLFEKEYKHKRR